MLIIVAAEVSYYLDYEKRLHERERELNLREKGIADRENEIHRRTQAMLESEAWLRMRWDRLLDRERILLAKGRVCTTSLGFLNILIILIGRYN